MPGGPRAFHRSQFQSGLWQLEDGSLWQVLSLRFFICMKGGIFLTGLQENIKLCNYIVQSRFQCVVSAQPLLFCRQQSPEPDCLDSNPHSGRNRCEPSAQHITSLCFLTCEVTKIMLPHITGLV